MPSSTSGKEENAPEREPEALSSGSGARVRGLLFRGVGLLRADGAGDTILALVEFGFVRSWQMTVLGVAHVALVMVDRRLAVFEIRGLMGHDLPALHSLPDTILLARFSLLKSRRENTGAGSSAGL
jgi:hypothetical protein